VSPKGTSSKGELFPSFVDDRAMQNEGRRAHSVLSGAARLFSAQAIRRLVRWPFLLVVARVLGPELFGVYAFLIALVEMLAVVSGQSFSDYLARESAKFPDSARKLAVRLTQLRCFYIVLLLAITFPILLVSGYSPSILGSAACLSIILFPRAIFESSQGLMRGANHLVPFPWLELLQGAVLLGIGIPVLVLGGGLRGLIWTEIASALSGTVAAVPLSLPLFPRIAAFQLSWKKLVQATLAFNVFPLIVNLYDRLDVVLLSKLAGNLAVGIYATPYRVLSTLQCLPGGLMTALLPSLSRSLWDDKESQRCDDVMTVLYVAALLFILVTMLLADPVVLLALGKSYAGSALVLKILIWATIPMFLNFGLNMFLLARSREKLFLRTASVCFVVNVVANLVLIPRFSYFAAAGVTIATELVLLVQNVFIVRSSLGFLPMPGKFLRVSIGFVLLLGAGVTAMQHLPIFANAALFVVVFVLYLYVSGSTSSFASLAKDALSAG